jgi:hypothetical protein
MAGFVFRCPITAQHVQGWVPEDVDDSDPDDYRAVTCLACRRIHRVNPKTGKVLGHDDEMKRKIS